MQKFDFKFGANVYGRNKHYGQLSKVVIEPRSRQLTGLIIEDGFFFKRTTVLPISEVEDAFAQTVHLKINSEQLKKYPEFQETTIEKGAPEWPATKTVGEMEYVALPSTNIPNLAPTREKVRVGVSHESLVLDSNTQVECLEGHVGSLSHVIVDARDHLISDLVFTRGTLFPKSYIVPTHYVESLGETKTQIAKTRLEAEQLSEYTFLNNS